jgi:L-threonylcarbamoyladenylate synthase
VQTEVLSADKKSALLHAVDVLRNGGLVAFPTDTVYGLASLAFQGEFVDRLYIVKGRSHTKAIAILLPGAEALPLVAHQPSQMALILAQHFWPGPLTLIVPRHPDIPQAVSTLPTVGVRVPDHPVALELLRLAGPLAVTSANLSGRPSPTTPAEVLEQLGGRIHLLIDGGRTPRGVPSTVVDCTGSQPVILRPGPLSLEALQKALRNCSG